jgi:hypothetical protein
MRGKGLVEWFGILLNAFGGLRCLGRGIANSRSVVFGISEIALAEARSIYDFGLSHVTETGGEQSDCT